MNNLIADADSFDMPLTRRETARFWRDSRFDAMECLSATFHTLQYAPHSHETYCIGAMEAGLQIYRVRGVTHTAGAGDLYLINPGDIHEGRPHEKGYRYRMIYPSVALMREVLEDARGKQLSGTPYFPRDAVSSPELAAEFIRLHKQMEAGLDRLETESRFHDFLVRLMGVHGGFRHPETTEDTGRAVYVARDYLDAHFAEDVRLSDIANAASLSRAHLVRAFKTEFHTPPHAWLTDRRIREARRLLRQGTSIADTALDCGFADQAHLTRHFKSRNGVTPAVYREKRTI